MADNNIKVTLSAVDEATATLQRVTAELKKLETQTGLSSKATQAHGAAAHESSLEFLKMGEAIKQAAETFAAWEIARFVKDTFDLAVEIEHLATKTGISTEALSVLRVAADQSNVGFEQLSNGLIKFNKFLADLEAGTPKATNAVKSLGFSAKEFVGLKPDEAFLKIATAMNRFGDGAAKTRVAIDLFGKSGADMLPLIKSLADDGFEEFRKKAEKLGLVFSEETTAKADAFNREMKDLKLSFEGLVVALLPVLGPLGKLVELLQSQPSDFFKKFFDPAVVNQLGEKLNDLAGQHAGNGTFFGRGGLLGLVSGQQAPGAGDALNRDPNLATTVKRQSEGKKDELHYAGADKAKAQAEAALAEVKAAAQRELEAIKTANAEKEAADSASYAEGLTSIDQYYRARRDRINASIDAEIAVLSAERNAIKPTEDTPAARTKADTERKNVQAKIDDAGVRRQTELEQNSEQLRQRRLALTQTLVGEENKLRTAQGQQLDAARATIAVETQRYFLQLKQNGATDEEAQAEAQKYNLILTQQARITDLERQAQRIQSDVDQQKAEIQNRVTAGTLDEYTAKKEIAALEASRKDDLLKIADQMATFARELGNPDLVASAEKLHAEIDGMGVSLTRAQELARDLSETLRNSITGDLAAGLEHILSIPTQQQSDLAGVRGQLAGAQQELQKLMSLPLSQDAKQQVLALKNEVAGLSVEAQNAADRLPTLFDRLREMGASIADSIKKALSDLIAATLVERTEELFGAQSSAAVLTAAGQQVAGAMIAGANAAALRLIAAASALTASSAGSAAAGAGGLLSALTVLGGLPFAEGGYVSGPGSATSDSIPARLSDGEFVMRAAAVDRYGPDFFRALNGINLPPMRSFGVARFAAGGLVSGAGSGSGGSDSASIRAVIGLDDGLVLRHLDTTDGHRTVVRIAQKNRKAFRQALGL